jgi:hypothetical protein
MICHWACSGQCCPMLRSAPVSLGLPSVACGNFCSFLPFWGGALLRRDHRPTSAGHSNSTMADTVDVDLRASPALSESPASELHLPSNHTAWPKSTVSRGCCRSGISCVSPFSSSSAWSGMQNASNGTLTYPFASSGWEREERVVQCRCCTPETIGVEEAAARVVVVLVESGGPLCNDRSDRARMAG